VTPQLILDAIVTGNVQTILGDGIPGLWPLLLKAENIPVKLNYEVQVSNDFCTVVKLLKLLTFITSHTTSIAL
jgi:hypothetical protein